MEYAGSCVLCIVITILVWLWNKTRRAPKLPPGPPIIPFLGNLNINFGDILTEFRKFRLQYGDLYSLVIGSRTVVIVNGHQTLKEIFIKHGDIASERADTIVTSKIAKYKGLITSSGSLWKEHRTFALSKLRDLGFGKRMMEEKVLEEVVVFLQSISDTEGANFDISSLLRISVSNVICSVAFRRRFEHDDQLQKAIFDLFVAGTDTTATALRWFILILLHKPEIQDRMRTEIHSKIGEFRFPSTADRSKLPYCDSVLHEVLRFGNTIPIPMPRGLTEDLFFQGFIIPKHALLFPNFDSVHSDPNVFENPAEFIPTRFLSNDGFLTGTENVIAFGIGPRICLGESLARMELFLFAVSMVQRFEFLPPDGDPLPTIHEFKLGLTRKPLEFSFKAIKCEESSCTYEPK
ncbi:hypothetical protein FSP39_008030 [Pinctada imbricata]|uniref:Cytochrome P450 n=1 Tax=Pinctada imbricata TaxID=66713 RepID=A0AA88XF33_PINIB|nr:hypothetical protein FSP39_008030 [Pinctada imbricata]